MNSNLINSVAVHGLFAKKGKVYSFAGNWVINSNLDAVE